jgi:hypothetical protein
MIRKEIVLAVMLKLIMCQTVRPILMVRRINNWVHATLASVRTTLASVQSGAAAVWSEWPATSVPGLDG